MTVIIRITSLLVMLMLMVLRSQSEVSLPKILGNNMVLQRLQSTPVWGSASAGEQVRVDFNDQHKSTVADASGKWMVLLDAMPASASAKDMVITGNNVIRLRNILVGEVWLCSGQSNMEYTMRKNSKVVFADSGINSPVRELERANNPSIRIFLVTSKNLRAADTTHSGWAIARDSALRSFSAAGYFFAKELFAKLGVPVGVISSAVPGTAIEPWLTGTIEATTQVSSPGRPVKINETAPGKFFPLMIQPLAPFALKGFLWYQGETNCFQNETLEYTYKMQALIEGWRKLWNNKQLPFYFVQIAPFYYSKNAGSYPLTKETLPRFWEAQAMVLELPNTGMVTTTDLVASPEDLHPGFKWEVGRRLALVALANTYKIPVVASGPVFKEMKVLDGSIELTFENIGAGLVSKDGKPLSSFLISGADNKYVPATAVIMGDKILVSGVNVPKPNNLRFEWDEEGKANLFNKDGLPAVPFRTDNPLRHQ